MSPQQQQRRDLPVWCRMSAEIQHDEDFLSLSSANAMAVFMLSIPIAKERRQDGEFSLRDLVPVFLGKIELNELDQIAAELVEAGFWLSAGGMKYIVRSFTRWNESLEEQAEAKSRRKLGALRANHKQGRHATHTPGCPDCETAGQSPSLFDEVAIANAVANADASLDERRETLDERRNTNDFSSDASGAEPDDHAEARQLCEEFADHLVRLNPADKRKNPTKEWVKAMDRLMRIDGRTPEQIRNAITWLETPEGDFWGGVVLSVPKFRQKYAQIRNSAKQASAEAARRKARAEEVKPNDEWNSAYAVASSAFLASRRAGSPSMRELLAAGGHAERLIEAAIATIPAFKTMGERDAKFAFRDNYESLAAAQAVPA